MTDLAELPPEDECSVCGVTGGATWVAYHVRNRHPEAEQWVPWPGCLPEPAA